MEIDNLKQRLEAKKNKIEEEELAREFQVARQHAIAYDEVMALMPEVKEVFDIVEKIYEMNFEIPGGDKGFFSDGVSHKFGFMGGRRSDGAPVAIGWYNGGWCGKYDIYCNGEDIWASHETIADEYRAVTTREYRDFADCWVKFKERFLNWVDKELLADV